MLKAAQTFDECSDPFNGEWLRENDVTADECFELSTVVAVCVAAYAAGVPELREQIAVIGAMKLAGFDQVGIKVTYAALSGLKKTRDTLVDAIVNV